MEHALPYLLKVRALQSSRIVLHKVHGAGEEHIVEALYSGKPPVQKLEVLQGHNTV